MRATGIRYTSGSKATEQELKQLCSIAVDKLEARGFITEAEVLSSSAIKIGLPGRSFRIDVNHLGHNARLGHFVSSPKGYKRTDVPTWDQRVIFNDVVNELFDKWDLVALIKSGCFTVRDKRRGAHNESDWENQTPSWMGYHGAACNGMGMDIARITTEREAREELDSDRLEAEHKAKTRPARLEAARQSRKRARLFSQTGFVIVSGFQSWDKESKRNGKRVTHYQFAKLLLKLPTWKARKVKRASIDVTLNNAPLTLIQGGKAIGF